MNKLQELDNKSKDLLDNKYIICFSDVNGIIRGVKSFILGLNLGSKIDLNMEYEILGKELDITIGVNQLDDITTDQMYQLSVVFSRKFDHRIGYSITIQEKDDFNGKNYHIFSNKTNKDYRELHESYMDFKMKFKELLDTDELYVEYTLKGNKLIGGNKDYLSETDEFKVVSRHLSPKIACINNKFDNTISEKIREDVDYKGIINSEVKSIKDYFNKYFKPQDGLLLDKRYILVLDRGKITLDIIVDGFKLDMRYMHNKDYLKDFNLEINNIDVNLVLNNSSIMDTVSGGYNSIGNRTYEVVRNSVKSDIAMQYMEDIDKKAQDNLSHLFSINSNFGKIIIDITERYSDFNYTNYKWSKDFGVSKGNKFIFYFNVGDGGVYRFSESETQELEDRLSKDSIKNVYDFIQDNLTQI